MIAHLIMPKSYQIDPDNYERCLVCGGKGTVEDRFVKRSEHVSCPECGGSGSIKKHSRIKPDPSPSPSPKPPPQPIARTKTELDIRFEEELGKAQRLRKNLLEAIPSSLQLNPDAMFSADKLISSIDPLSKSTDETLEKLQFEWSRKLQREDRLLDLLSQFKWACFQAQTYRKAAPFRTTGK